MNSNPTRPHATPSTTHDPQGTCSVALHASVDRSKHYPTLRPSELPSGSPDVAPAAPRVATGLSHDSGLSLCTQLSHWLQAAELDEVASVVREVEFTIAARFHAAQKHRNESAAGFWRGLLVNTSALVKALEKQSELRRKRHNPRALPEDFKALPPFDSADVGGAP